MLPPEMGRAAFRLGLTIMIPAAWLLFVVKPGSVGFVVTVFCLAISVIFLGVITIIVRFFSH